MHIFIMDSNYIKVCCLVNLLYNLCGDDIYLHLPNLLVQYEVIRCDFVLHCKIINAANKEFDGKDNLKKRQLKITRILCCLTFQNLTPSLCTCTFRHSLQQIGSLILRS